MQNIAQRAKRLPVEEDDVDTTIHQLTLSIRHNLALLHGLIESRRPTQHATVVDLSNEVQSLVVPDFVDVGESRGRLNAKFLETRVNLWNRILAAPDPRLAFVRWLKHLNDVTSGRLPCPIFKNLFLLMVADVMVDALVRAVLRYVGG